MSYCMDCKKHLTACRCDYSGTPIGDSKPPQGGSGIPKTELEKENAALKAENENLFRKWEVACRQMKEPRELLESMRKQSAFVEACFGKRIAEALGVK